MKKFTFIDGSGFDLDLNIISRNANTKLYGEEGTRAVIEMLLQAITELQDKLHRRNILLNAKEREVEELKKQLEVAQQTRIVLGETDKTISEVKAIRKEDGQVRWLHFETPKTTSEIKERFTLCYSGSWEIEEIKNI